MKNSWKSDQNCFAIEMDAYQYLVNTVLTVVKRMFTSRVRTKLTEKPCAGGSAWGTGGHLGPRLLPAGQTRCPAFRPLRPH